MTAALDLASVFIDRLARLLEVQPDLAGVQILKPEAGEQTRTPFLRIQAEVQGPASGWEGSAHRGVWTLYCWVTVVTARADTQAGVLRNLEASVRDVLFAEHQAGYANLTNSTFKVWQIEFDPIEYQQDDSHDARAQPMRVHCAVFTA